MSSLGRLALTLRRGEVALGAALLLFGCGIAWGAMYMPEGTLGAPGPGFFPGVLGTLLALTAAGLVVRASRLKPADDEAVDLGHRHIALTVAALAVLSVLLEPLGYIVSATLFMLVLLGAFSSLGWLRSLVAALLSAGVSDWFFVQLLGVALPSGVLSFS